MQFVELNRCFVPLGKDEEPNLDIGRVWGRKIGGWLEWSELREHRRVVLLAEALSGKSEEFRNQAEKLSAQGHSAFCIRIEELADQGFETAMDPGAAKLFDQWRNGTSNGWFFLDSVDEARLNRKSFETALKRFARELDQSLERARVFISCRVSDWKGREDQGAIERFLPSWEHESTKSASDSESDALLDPIFKPKEQARTGAKPQPEQNRNELLLVQIVPLSIEQCRTLAGELGVKDLDAFINEIRHNGLEAFTERPGDVIDLADYWTSYGRFDSLAVMVEHSINYKLKETDLHRPDNEALSLQKARGGGERVAAALTLGKSFTLRAPGHDPDPSLASGALDPSLILHEWTDAERNALVRRGIFAPSTYGRVRFHQRSTQEYLTAQWLDRLLRSNCPRSEIWNLIFADRYGVKTVVPSLRPAAAWLALRHSDFLNEIIDREPLILIRHGDPGSLSLETKKRLLATYAKKHAVAEIADDSLDKRALWMFANNGLAETIRDTWATNSRRDFRMVLLRLIREGAISACSDLARVVALDEAADDYLRIVAVDALIACKDQEGLSAVARLITKDASKASVRLAPPFAKALFPHHLTIAELLSIIADSRPPREHSAEGFPNVLIDLYNACPDGNSRTEFVGGLAKLCDIPPFVDDYQRVSARHLQLAQSLIPIAKAEIDILRDKKPSDYLIRLLMVVERADRGYRPQDEWLSLCKGVQANLQLQQKLFWADVDEQRSNSSDQDPFTSFWYAGHQISRLWEFHSQDLPWLYHDLVHRTAEADQRVALSAIVWVLQQAGELKAKADELTERVKASHILAKDLEGYLKPPPVDVEGRRHTQQLQAHNKRVAEQEERNKLSWIKFREDLNKNPDQLRDPQFLGNMGAGMFRLWTLTEWLQHRTGAHEDRAPLEWRRLEDAFGPDIAEAYRDGMKALWRCTNPERPKQREGGGFTVKYSTILAFAAIGLEAGSDPDWPLGFTANEALKAAQHGCQSEQGYPEWIEALVSSHPQVVLPEIKRVISYEWRSPSNGRTDFLFRYATPTFSILLPIQEILFRTFLGPEPRDVGKLERELHILKSLDLDERQKRTLTRGARRRFTEHATTGRDDFALRYLALLLLLNIDNATDDLKIWLKGTAGRETQPGAERTFAGLFYRHDPTIPTALNQASVQTLERLLTLSYFYVRPVEDLVHDGAYSPSTRDDAESARDIILRALLNRSGADAFRTLKGLAEKPEFALRAERLRELARAKAESDAEPPAWNEEEVVSFEVQRTAPVKTGADLLRVVLSIFNDIQLHLVNDDVSSRSLLERAKDEDEVKDWIVEQMNYRSLGRFNAYREAQVAGKNKPDVIVSSTTAQCEVGIEVKHGGKGWTLRKLETALRLQLARDYLKPLTRRHGIFLVTHHGRRLWRDTESHSPMSFEALIGALEAIARTLIENDSGPIEVKCFGIDASSSNEKRH